MATVNMLEAKSNLSRLVEAVESGSEAEIVIARNGRPAAKLVPIRAARQERRILVVGRHDHSETFKRSKILCERERDSRTAARI